MPILGPSPILPPPPVTNPGDSAGSTLAYIYIDPDNVVWSLSDLELSFGYIATDVQGCSGVPVQLTTAPLARGGAVPIQYLYQPRQILVGIYAEAPGQDPALQAGYLQLLDQLSSAFYTERGGLPAPGQFIVQRPDGSARKVSVLVTSGNEQPGTSISSFTEGSLWTVYALTLEADDPFFEDLSPTIVHFSEAPGGGGGILPLLPISLSSSSVLGDVIVDNSGTAQAWPEWVITGPGTPVVSNLTTGLQWSLSTPLGSGQQVQVITKPGQQSVTDLATGDSLWSELIAATPADLWPLERRNNHLSLTIGGATSDSALDMLVARRWIRA